MIPVLVLFLCYTEYRYKLSLHCMKDLMFPIVQLLCMQVYRLHSFNVIKLHECIAQLFAHTGTHCTLVECNM